MRRAHGKDMGVELRVLRPMYVPMAVVAVINTRTAQLTQKYAPSVRAGKTCDDEWGK